VLGNISLQEMNFSEVKTYIEFSQREYAQGMLDQGEYPDYETSLRAAINEISYYYNQVLPGETHYAYHIVNAKTGERVGILAFSILVRRDAKQPFVFVDYISVFPPFRRHGYARYAMQWLENWTRNHELKTIELNVMKHRRGAYLLYGSLGYHVYQERALGLSKIPGRYDMRKELQN
jgi:GNAT superfamily N-acetyltransferase